jgi:TRAP-type mannitol/chloroaromatic compound transport system substrate-binding protein
VRYNKEAKNLVAASVKLDWVSDEVLTARTDVSDEVLTACTDVSDEVLKARTSVFESLVGTGTGSHTLIDKERSLIVSTKCQ